MVCAQTTGAHAGFSPDRPSRCACPHVCCHLGASACLPFGAPARPRRSSVASRPKMFSGARASVCPFLCRPTCRLPPGLPGWLRAAARQPSGARHQLHQPGPSQRRAGRVWPVRPGVHAPVEQRRGVPPGRQAGVVPRPRPCLLRDARCLGDKHHHRHRHHHSHSHSYCNARGHGEGGGSQSVGHQVPQGPAGGHRRRRRVGQVCDDAAPLTCPHSPRWRPRAGTAIACPVGTCMPRTHAGAPPHAPPTCAPIGTRCHAVVLVRGPVCRNDNCPFVVNKNQVRTALKKGQGGDACTTQGSSGSNRKHPPLHEHKHLATHPPTRANGRTRTHAHAFTRTHPQTPTTVSPHTCAHVRTCADTHPHATHTSPSPSASSPQLPVPAPAELP